MSVRSTLKGFRGTAWNGYGPDPVEFRLSPPRRRPGVAKSGSCLPVLHIRTNYIWKTITAIILMGTRAGHGNGSISCFSRSSWAKLCVITTYREQGDAMTKLSPKAMRFVDAAVTKSNSDQIRAVWNAYLHAPAKQLSDEVAQAALGALQQAERDLRNRLESSLGEDEAADLSNDLGFIRAIKSDLTRSLGPTQRKG
jgi:hypothetical protein